VGDLVYIVALGSLQWLGDMKKTHAIYSHSFSFIEPSHWVCKPAYSVPVPSQDKLGGLWQEGHQA